MYANIDNYTPAEGMVPQPEVELDRWILSELNQLIKDVDTALDGYNPTDAGRKIEGFIDGLSNWYVRRSRRRFWRSENDSDKDSAYNTLYYCLVTLSKLMAPFTPFLAEEIYRNLVTSVFPEAPDSVHLTDFPVADETRIDSQLAADNRLVMKLCSLGRAARSRAGIKVRQPLETLYVGVTAESEKRAVENAAMLIMEELNIKEVLCDAAENVGSLAEGRFSLITESELTVAISTHISVELEAEGIAREVAHRVQTMRRNAGYEIADHIRLFYEGDAYFVQSMSAFADYVMQETLADEIDVEVPDNVDIKENHKVNGYNLLLGIKKVS
jgi:isoleucyl-tRNA synthetase